MSNDMIIRIPTVSRRLKINRAGQFFKKGEGHGNKVSHRFSKAIILVDVAILCEQFKSMAQSYPAPDAFCQFPSLDIVHFTRLAVLKDDTLAAQS